MTNWTTIAPRHNEVIHRVVAVFHIQYFRGPSDLAVEVRETGESPDAPYLGVLNYEFWGPEQSDSYIQAEQSPTIEEAVSAALQTYRAFDREEYPKELIFWVPTYGDRSVVVNGYGEQISHGEVSTAMKCWQTDQRDWEY